MTRLMRSQGCQSRLSLASLALRPALVHGVRETDRRQITAGCSNAIASHRDSPSSRLPQHRRCNRFALFLGLERIVDLPVLAVGKDEVAPQQVLALCVSPLQRIAAGPTR